jgi:predicted amidohydrolase YtcJ
LKLLIRGKHVWGLDESIDSVLIKDDEIIATGDYNDLSSPDITTHKYEDYLILPGFTDAHLHLSWLGKLLDGCDLRNIDDTNELATRIKTHKVALSENDFLLGYGYNEQEWRDDKNPTCSLIDSACGNHPAVLTRIDGHSWLINSKMMVIAGISTVTDPKLKSHIQYDRKGLPTGVIFDKAFFELVQPLLPKAKPELIKKYLLLAQDHLLSLGITSCRSFGSLDDFLMLASLEQDDLLKMRICGCIPVDSLDWALSLATQTGNGSDYFWVGQIKIFADGSLGSRTALISQPYPDGTLGLEIISTDGMKTIIEKAHSNGLGVAIHAIGDIAVANVVEALKNGDSKDTIEHFQCGSKQTILKLSKTKVNVVINPSHMPIDYKFINREWRNLKDMVYPSASLIKAGISVGFGSDAPVVTADPFYAVACVTTRQGINTGKINPKEAIPFYSAMKIALENSAQIIGGPKRGCIKKGYKADIIISEDFRGKEPWEIPGTKIRATYVGGKKVWEK